MWVVDLNRQSLDRVVPDIAAGRLCRDVRGRRLAHRDGQVRPAPLQRRRRGAPRPHRRDAERGVPAAAARGRRPRCASASRATASRAISDLEDARAAGHLPRPRRPRPRALLDGYRAGRRGPRPPFGRLRLHDQGLVAADRGPSRQPLGAAQPRAVPRPARKLGSGPRRSRGRRSRPDSAGGRLCTAAGRRLRRERDPRPSPPRGSRPTSAASTPARPPPSRPSGASSSTSPARRPTRRRARGDGLARRRHRHQPRRLDQPGRASGASASASTGSPMTPTRSCAGASQTTGATSSSASPRSTSSGCSASSARPGRATGPAAAAGRHDLRPVRGARAGAVVVRHLRRRPVDPRRHAERASRWGPRAARTSRSSRPRSGSSSPAASRTSRPSGRTSSGASCTRSAQLGRAGRQLGLLPALHAPDRPVAAHRHARGRARRRLPAARPRRARRHARRDGRARTRGDRAPRTRSPPTPGSTPRSSA